MCASLKIHLKWKLFFFLIVYFMENASDVLLFFILFVFPFCSSSCCWFYFIFSRLLSDGKRCIIENYKNAIIKNIFVVLFFVILTPQNGCVVKQQCMHMNLNLIFYDFWVFYVMCMLFHKQILLGIFYWLVPYAEVKQTDLISGKSKSFAKTIFLSHCTWNAQFQVSLMYSRQCQKYSTKQKHFFSPSEMGSRNERNKFAWTMKSLYDLMLFLLMLGW